MTITKIKGGYVAPQELQDPAIPSARTPAKPGEAHTVVQGDTLWKLAQEAYGDATKWPLIRDANPGNVTMRGDVAIIVPGKKLTIPALETPSQGWAPSGGQGLRVPTGPSGEGLRVPTRPSGEGLQLPGLPADARIGGKPQLPETLPGLPVDAAIGGKPQLPETPPGLPADGRIGGKPELPVDFKPAGSAFGAFVALKPQLGELQKMLSLPQGIRERVMTALDKGEKPAPPFDGYLDLVNHTRAQLKAQLEALPPDQAKTLLKVVDEELSNLPLARQALLGGAKPQAGAQVASAAHEPGVDLGAAADAMNGTAPATAAQRAEAEAAAARTVGVRLDAAIAKAKEDGLLQIPEFGSLIRALGEDMVAAKTPEEANAIWTKATESLGTYLESGTVPVAQRDLLRDAVQAFQRVASEGTPQQVVEFGKKVEQVELPADLVPKAPRTMGAVLNALTDKAVRPQEFAPVVRAMIADLKANGSKEAFMETVVAFDFLSGQVDMGAHTAAFTKLYTDFAKHVQAGPNEATLQRFAAEFDKLK